MGTASCTRTKKVAGFRASAKNGVFAFSERCEIVLIP